MKKSILIRNIANRVTGILFLLFICNFVNAQNRDISFTIEDRDRIIQTQAEVASLRNEMNGKIESVNGKIESVNEKIESLRNEMKTEIASLHNDMDRIFTLMYFVLGGLIGLIGLIFWDRRSYIIPIKEDIKNLQNALRDYAKRKPESELAVILRTYGLM